MQVILILGGLCFLLAVGVNGQGQGEPQRVHFYKNANGGCSKAGLMAWILETDDNLRSHPQVSQATAVNLIGLWRVYEQNGGKIIHHLYYSKDETTCNNLKKGHAYTKVERFGGPYQSEKEITFYTEERFHGVKTSSNFIGELSLPKKTVIRSWHFTGNHEWTIYENTDFTGRATCFRPIPKNLNQWGEGITYELETKINVGSAKLGCSGFGSSNSGNVAAVSASLLLFAASILLR